MNDAERNALANIAYKALENQHVIDVIKELLRNLQLLDGGLPEYGIRKVAHYAAIIARCQALNIDPDEMVMSPREVVEHQVQLAKAFTDAGKPVIVIRPDEAQS